MAENNISKNRTSGREGAKYSYKYTDIAQIHDYLESKGISYYQYIDCINGNDYVMTVPIIDGKELTARRGCRVTDATLVGINNPAQEQGSAITYARRYSLLMAFGLATEDDDAQSLSKPKEEPKKAEPKKEKSEVIRIGKGHIATIKSELERTGVPIDYFCKAMKVKSLEEMTIEDFKVAMDKFSKTRDKE